MCVCVGGGGGGESWKTMPVAPKRGLVHGCCGAAASCVAVEANPRSAFPAADRTDEACGCVGC